MLIADTGGLAAVYNRSDANHDRVRAFLVRNREALVVSPYVVAELDYMVTARVHARAARLALGDLSEPSFVHAEFGKDSLVAAIAVIDRYADQAIGITDASLVVLAARYRTHDILTLDHRHFDMLRPLDGGSFRLMPRDWDGG